MKKELILSGKLVPLYTSSCEFHDITKVCCSAMQKEGLCLINTTESTLLFCPWCGAKIVYKDMR